MNATALLYPLLAQVALTFVMLFWMGRARVGALRRGEVKLKDIAVGQRAWPTRVAQISNTYQNQFEVPMLFYVLVMLCLIQPRTADHVMVSLAWLFVATRLVHAYIYTTSNAIRWRFNAFLVGVVVLLAMWVLFAVRATAA